jgi:predicted aldo/keto reductase-like oxidoreductase
LFKFISNIFQSKNKKIEEKAFRYLQEVSIISKQIAAEKNETKLRALAFSLRKNYEIAINLLKEINYDMNQIEKAYFDPDKTLSSDNYRKVEAILKNFENTK